MTHEDYARRRKNYPMWMGVSWDPARHQTKKHFRELDMQPHQEIKKGSLDTKREIKWFVKMRIAACVLSTFPHNSTRFLVLIVMLNITADKGVAK